MSDLGNALILTHNKGYGCNRAFIPTFFKKAFFALFPKLPENNKRILVISRLSQKDMLFVVNLCSRVAPCQNKLMAP